MARNGVSGMISGAWKRDRWVLGGQQRSMGVQVAAGRDGTPGFPVAGEGVVGFLVATNRAYQTPYLVFCF